MFDSLRKLFERRIAPEEFERCVFAAVMHHITDPVAVKQEIAIFGNLGEHATSNEKREQIAARNYLKLEEHIQKGQEAGRMSREALRGYIAKHCHAERADGGFALLFLTVYAREIRLILWFVNSLFERARNELQEEAYGEALRAIDTAARPQRFVKNNLLAWDALFTSVRHLGAEDQLAAVRAFAKDAVGVLVKKLFARVETVRTEYLLQEAYRALRNQLEFLDDVPTVLVVVPDGLLVDERVGLMEKRELEQELLRKSQEFEMTLSRLREEQAKLSTLSREELEKRVEERTSELMKALGEVKAGRAQLEEFSSLATHELRAPVGIIKGYATLLLEGSGGPLTEKEKQFIAHIKEADERLLKLINAMLNASRIELGTLAIEPEPIYLPDLADKVLLELAPQAEGKQLRIEKHYDRKMPIVNVDPHLMRAVIQNLLSNSVKYTPKGGTVGIWVEKKEPDILITVSDTGYGIPSDEQAKVFTKLFRADNIRTKHVEGTGLGLYIAKSVLEQAGGKIWFESPAPASGLADKPVGKPPHTARGEAKNENPGTAFYVTIPLAGMRKKEGIRGLS
jgi:signal transduction histidine kinase